MRIYTPAPLEGFEWITLQDGDPDQWETLFALSGPVGADWRPLRMSFIREEEDGTPRRVSDVPWCLHNVFVIREPALELLRPVLAPYGELLALRCEAPVSLFNATRIIDALDEDRSTIVRFDDGSVLTIERHVFRPDAIGDTEIFRLPGRGSYIYLRESAVHRIGALGLRGLAFDLVWGEETVSPGEHRIEYPGER